MMMVFKRTGIAYPENPLYSSNEPPANFRSSKTLCCRGKGTFTNAVFETSRE